LDFETHNVRSEANILLEGKLIRNTGRVTTFPSDDNRSSGQGGPSEECRVSASLDSKKNDGSLTSFRTRIRGTAQTLTYSCARNFGFDLGRAPQSAN